MSKKYQMHHFAMIVYHEICLPYRNRFVPLFYTHLEQCIYIYDNFDIYYSEHHRWEGSVGFRFWRPLARLRKPP